jgi:hypothetical protein
MIMKLSPDEKNIIELINKGEFTSVLDFIKHIKMHRMTNHHLDSWYGPQVHIQTDKVWLIETENEKDFIKKIQLFYSVIMLLKNDNYIDILDVDITNGNWPPLVKANFRLFIEALNLIDLMHEVKIAKRTALEDFIDNNFKTLDEIAFEAEKKARKISIGVAIGIGIGSLIITTIFNVLTFTTDRTVKIIQMPSNRDTLRVLIIDTLKQNLPAPPNK